MMLLCRAAMRLSSSPMQHLPTETKRTPYYIRSNPSPAIDIRHTNFFLLVSFVSSNTVNLANEPPFFKTVCVPAYVHLSLCVTVLKCNMLLLSLNFFV